MRSRLSWEKSGLKIRRPQRADFTRYGRDEKGYFPVRARREKKAIEEFKTRIEVGLRRAIL